MATVTNWIDHLSASEVQGAVYPGVGTETYLVLALVVIWIGSHVIADMQEVSKSKKSEVLPLEEALKRSKLKSPAIKMFFFCSRFNL